MEISQNTSLARYTTLKIGGDADHLYHPHTKEELIELVATLEREKTPWHLIGGGSNLLVSSAGVKGAVIRTTHLTNIRVLSPGLLEAEAGARLPHLAKQAAKLGLSGLEFAVGIPGTVGGGVIMNAGAHGSSMSAILQSALVLDSLNGQVTEMGADQIEFEYRRCILDPKRHCVLSAKFVLDIAEPEVIEAKTQANEDYRWKTQPIGFANAGSTFKNPRPDRTAGYLLDQAGVKNLRHGNAAVSAIHANFVINLGGATSQEVTDLLREMQATVKEKFGEDLTPEWKTMGEFTSEELKVWEKK